VAEPYRLQDAERANVLFLRAAACEWIAREAGRWALQFGGTDMRAYTEPLLGASRAFQTIADCDRTEGRHLKARPLPSEATPPRAPSARDLERISRPAEWPAVAGPDDER
jgi:hypothetical protein